MDECKEIKLLIPWLINGSLQVTEKVTVFRHLEKCSECRAALVFFISINQATLLEQGCVMSENRKTMLLNEIMSDIKNIQKTKENNQGVSVQSTLNRVSKYPFAAQNIVINCLKEIYAIEAMKILKCFKPMVNRLRKYQYAFNTAEARVN